MTFDLFQILVSLLIFTSIFLLVWSIFGYPPLKEPAVNRRIALAMGAGKRDTVFEQSLLSPLMGAFVEIGRRLPLMPLRTRIRHDLESSGNPMGYTVEEYLAICMGTAVLLGIFAGLAGTFLTGSVSLPSILFMLVVGFFVPVVTLRGQAKARRVRISKKLPYTLDLVALMMAAGSAFNEAIEAVVRDEPEDDFNQELRIVQGEIEFGTQRAQALSNMANRVGLDSLYSIVGAINQSEALGSPLASILKDQSHDLRQLRKTLAEKAAAAAGHKILIPSMLILVAVVLVVFGPLIIQWANGTLLM